VNRLALLLGLVCLISGQSFARDQICDYVKAFERAPFERDASGREKFRWIEVHWIGAWLDLDHGWHLECRHSSDSASAAFCSWLTSNTSFEFEERLPLRILTCHGYRFPSWYGVGLFKSEFNFYSEATGEILLQINFDGHKKPDGAMRLSVYPQHQDSATETSLPPMIDESVNSVADSLHRPQY
jgi:hypothetical protein